MKKILFASWGNPLDPGTWSGTTCRTFESLKSVFPSVEPFGPLDPGRPLLMRARGALRRMSGGGFSIEQTRWAAMASARKLQAKLDSAEYDAVFTSTVPLAYLPPGVPAFGLLDSNFACMLDYYPDYSNLPAGAVKEADEIERRGIHRCRRIFYASEWARNSAIEHYGAGQDQAIFIPLGANLDQLPARDEVEQFVQARDRKHMHLLFLGVEWVRKGGDIAVEIARSANERGTPTTLHVVGCQLPKRHQGEHFIDEVGFLDKRKEDDLARLRELLRICHFLAFPSRAECYGIAVSEASAYAMPSLGADTGGISSALRDGVNGRLFPLEAGGDAYAAEAAALFHDWTRYAELARSSRSLFESDLNWDVTAQRLHYWMTKPAPSEQRAAARSRTGRALEPSPPESWQSG